MKSENKDKCFFCYKDAEGNHAACVKKFFGSTVIPVLELNNELLNELATQNINKRIAITGVQPKLSLTLNIEQQKSRLTIVGLWGEYMLKPQHPEYPYMPETEDLTMHIAELFKIPVCEHTLMETLDGQVVYVAKRFDRPEGKKIHMEDLCQVSELLTENKYKSSYEKAGKLISQYCFKGLDLINYFELVLFSYLSGNNDMHLKNFSLMHKPNGIELSPAYDLLNINLLNPKDKEDLALTLNGKKSRINLSDFISFAKTLGINERSYNNSFKLFSSKNSEVMKMIDRSFLSEQHKVLYKEIWHKNQSIFQKDF